LYFVLRVDLALYKRNRAAAIKFSSVDHSSSGKVLACMVELKPL
jgi:hypothetical protein